MFRARVARPAPPRPVVLELPQERVFMGEKHHGAPRKAMEAQGRTGNTREKTRGLGKTREGSRRTDQSKVGGSPDADATSLSVAKIRKTTPRRGRRPQSRRK